MSLISHVSLLALSCTSLCLGIGIPADGAGDGMSEQEQMAWLANAVYKFRTPIAGWELLEQLQLKSRCAEDHDNFAIYHDPDGSKCVIAIAGTDSLGDMFDNFDGRTVADCGFPDIHSGYMGEVNDFLRACAFQDRFLPLLTGSACSGGISVVGHSLGGGVASVLAACANNPLQPYGFNVSKLYTFGAPAVSGPHPLHNPLSSDTCFEGARIWNQDKIFIDPIPGLSRGLNFFHPRIRAYRVRAKTAFMIGTGEYEATEYSCGTWKGHELPNTADGTPQPTLHVMSAYCSRMRQMFTGSSFSSPTMPPTATAAPSGMTDCSQTVNYTYADVSVQSQTRSDFDGWDYTSASFGTSYLIAFICFVIGLVSCRTMHGLFLASKALNQYYDNLYVADLFDKMKVELDEAQPEDPLEWLEKFVHTNRESKQWIIHQATKTKGFSKDQALSPLYLIGRCCGCRTKKKSHRRHNTAQAQFFEFIVLIGTSCFLMAVARQCLNSYHAAGESMGRRWSATNSGWMWPWTMGICLAPLSMMALFDIVLTMLSYPDWTVRWAHILGLLGAAGELQMMWTENLSNTALISSVICIIASVFSTIELIVALVKYRNSATVGINIPKSAVVFLLLATLSIFVGNCIFLSVNCEFPHNPECPLPESFSRNAVFTMLLTCALVMTCLAMFKFVRAQKSVHAAGEQYSSSTIQSTQSQWRRAHTI